MAGLPWTMMVFRGKKEALGLRLGSRVQGHACTITALWCALVLLRVTALAREADCPLECQCPKTLSCRPGVSLVRDGCGCCQVCARQFNEICSVLRPCDRGLSCQQSAGRNSSRGVCRASTPGRPCTKDGVVYQHGETLRPSCRLQCTCEDGSFGCRALCPLRMPVLPQSCPGAQLVRVPGTCCKKWKCGTRYSKVSVPGARRRKGSFDSTNEVVEHRVATRKSRGPFKSRSSQHAGCQDKGTEWSECSKTCGLGMSTRLSLHNTRCQLKEETRLCQIRPCSMLNQLHPKEGSGCLKTHKEKVPKPFVYEGCSSMKSYKPKYCGMCWDRRCCRPLETRTTRVRFQCPGSGTLVVMVAKIKKCECTRPKGQSRGCARPPLVTHEWKRSLWDLSEAQPHA